MAAVDQGRNVLCCEPEQGVNNIFVVSTEFMHCLFCNALFVPL